MLWQAGMLQLSGEGQGAQSAPQEGACFAAGEPWQIWWQLACRKGPLCPQRSAHVVQALCSCAGGSGHLLFAGHEVVLFACGAHWCWP